MKVISGTVLLGILLALPVIYFLDSNPDQPLNKGAIAFILLLTIGAAGVAIRQLSGKGKK